VINRRHKYKIALLFGVVFHPLEMNLNPKTNYKERYFFLISVFLLLFSTLPLTRLVA